MLFRSAKKGSYRPYTIIGSNVGLGQGDPIWDDTPEEGYYTQAELREIVQYAQERYITIIPEIDLPGHMVAPSACILIWVAQVVLISFALIGEWILTFFVQATLRL